MNDSVSKLQPDKIAINIQYLSEYLTLDIKIIKWK